MKRVLGLTLVAGVAVWAFALIDLGGAPRRRGSSPAGVAETVPAPEPAAARPATPAARPAAPGHVASRAALGRPSAFAQQSASGQPLPGPTGGRVHLIGSQTAAAVAASAAAARGVAAQVEPEPGELGEGVLSPEFAEFERSYVDEPREGPWALAHEQRVRALLRAVPLGQQVALVSCQQSVCRIVIEPAAADAFARLIQAPGLREATGLGPATPYSLRGGQLSVYFRPPAPAK